ncbi:polyprenyl synthetase family protein [Salinisphaera sp. Q1T1-3]|uniref:polyprenyl synthetase family protein n=1 Tax=Salinisphaera sp. Q1T1-3 TaxID=2321229 RepID=UPI000E743E6B|nr:polyprenyl synthetase family protein [Salinisphaera sp. Q1T1-3]RJS92100.1 polyprenyl synthetase family protein [Salinisphaera sp. Q1T1-3]
MDSDSRIEAALAQAMAVGRDADCPSGLAAATRHAVFSGGARVRPRLCLAVASACGEDCPAVSDGAAAAIELLHCASLVHDDLPCFDDAATRRGHAAIHQAFGEPLAVLAGDALIVAAFQTLAAGAANRADRLAGLVGLLSEAVGMPHGIVAGQAMECEGEIALEDYHRAKTGALFGAATMLGAAAAGHDPRPWHQLGDRIGQAYQIVDDIRDVTQDSEALGKPRGQDDRLGRPSAARTYGIAAARTRFDALMTEMVASVPECPGAATLRWRIVNESAHFFPGLAAEPAA